MRTKTSERTDRRPVPPNPRRPDLSSDTLSYWLEDDGGRRVSRRFASSDRAMALAGRVLENLGSLDGWSVARMDSSRVRHTVATGAALAELALGLGPVRTPREVEAVRRFNDALRKDPGFPRRANLVTDERVY